MNVHTIENISQDMESYVIRIVDVGNMIGGTVGKVLKERLRDLDMCIHREMPDLLVYVTKSKEQWTLFTDNTKYLSLSKIPSLVYFVDLRKACSINKDRKNMYDREGEFKSFRKNSHATNSTDDAWMMVLLWVFLAHGYDCKIVTMDKFHGAPVAYYGAFAKVTSSHYGPFTENYFSDIQNELVNDYLTNDYSKNQFHPTHVFMQYGDDLLETAKKYRIEPFSAN